MNAKTTVPPPMPYQRPPLLPGTPSSDAGYAGYAVRFEAQIAANNERIQQILGTLDTLLGQEPPQAGGEGQQIQLGRLPHIAVMLEHQDYLLDLLRRRLAEIEA